MDEAKKPCPVWSRAPGSQTLLDPMTRGAVPVCSGNVSTCSRLLRSQRSRYAVVEDIRRSSPVGALSATRAYHFLGAAVVTFVIKPTGNLFPVMTRCIPNHSKDDIDFPTNRSVEENHKTAGSSGSSNRCCYNVGSFGFYLIL